MDDAQLPIEPPVETPVKQQVDDVQPVSQPLLHPSQIEPPKATKELKPLHIGLLSLGILVVTGSVLFAINRITSPSPSSSSINPTPTAIAQILPTATPTITLSTSTPSPSPTPTPAPSPTPTPTPTATPTPTPATTTVTLSVVAGQDGYEASDGTGATDQDVRVGRTTTSTIRGFVGFDLATLPKTAHITNAVLRMYQQSIIGDPYGVSGGSQIIVDHLDYGSTINASTYGGGTVFASNIGTLSSGSQTEWKQLSVTDRVKNDLATHTSSQYRLRLTNETQGGPVTGDYASFNSPNSGYNSNPPQLVVTYY